MRRLIISLCVCLVLLCALLPGAYAANAYTINGVIVRSDDFSSSPGECWNYAQNVYQKIWGVSFSNHFSCEGNMLRNLSDSELTLTADHLKKYVSAASLGSVIRITNTTYLRENKDGDIGHSQVIVQKDSNGFTVFQGGLSASPYRNEKYYTWSQYINSWYDAKHCYIKYIQWPGNHSYSSNKSTLTVNGYLDGVETGSIDGYGFFDIWMDHELIADNVVDFNESFEKGSFYEITDYVRNDEWHTFHGAKTGALEGYLNSNTEVRLNYRTNDDVGDKFYAYITSKDGKHQLYNNGSGNVATGAPSTDPSHVWYFEKLDSYNHYKITSYLDGWSFDVTEGKHDAGTNLELIPFREDNVCQIWVCHLEDGYVEIGSKWTPCILDCGGDGGVNTYLNLEHESDENYCWFKITETNAPPKNYTITYNANGGTGAPGNQTKTYGQALTLSSTKPTRANSSAGSYKVTFNANGGSVSPASMDAARTTSYTFKSWNTKQDGSGTSYNAGASYTANAAATLYAQWNSSTKTAEITLPTPTRDGYNFKGWGTSNGATTGVTGKYTPGGNVTLYAVWEKKTYPITYNANGGTGAPGNQTKTYGQALTLSSTKPTRANSSAGSYKVTFNVNGGSVSPASMDAARTTSYTFKNWNTKQDGSGTSYNAGASYTANAAATLYAQWNSSTKTAEITLPTPIRGGCDFKGWGTSSDASSGITGKYTPSGNVTLYAIWTPKTYDIIYNANGGTGAPSAQIKYHGTDLAISSTKPTRANSSAGSYKVTFNANGGSVSPASMDAARTTSYTFKNWNTKQDGSGTSYNAGASYTANAAATLYAQWNSSTTTAAVTLPMPTRVGYDFKGWVLSGEVTEGATGSYTPDSNVTLYATWATPEPDFILPASLITIEEEAFAGGAFTYARIPEGTTRIERRAFADCPNLTHVYIPENATSIDSTAFSGVSSLTIHGKDGSYAEFYAGKYGFAFVAE